MTFLVVQHLDPQHESHLSELLSTSTTMPVKHAEHGTRIAPNTVYVIQPDTTLRLLDDILDVDRAAPRGAARHAVDELFKSLADAAEDRSVGIVLAGGGSDGSLGVRAVREMGGLTLAQAGEDGLALQGMPANAAASGMIDVLAPIERMAETLVEHVTRNQGLSSALATATSSEQSADNLSAICERIRAGVGHDFSQYKPQTLWRRIQRRMLFTHAASIGAYIELLDNDAAEVRAAFNEFLIGVTEFFRDAGSFEALNKKVIPRLLSGKSAEDAIRVWVPACSTGEEVYSIAMLFLEAGLGQHGLPKLQVFASDIDEAAISFARIARYDATRLAGLSQDRLHRWFVKVGELWTPRKELRDACIFSTHSVLRDPPFSKLDLICCRNLLIYLLPPAQDKLIGVFHYALRPEGFLFLGGSEGGGRQTRLFNAIDQRNRIFVREGVAGPSLVDGSAKQRRQQAASEPPVRALPTVDQIDVLALRALGAHVPAFVVVDDREEIIRFSNNATILLGPSSGAASLSLDFLIRKELRPAAHAVLKSARATGEACLQADLTLEIAGVIHRVDLTVAPLEGVPGDPLFVLSLLDRGVDSPRSDESTPTERERRTQAELVAVRDRLQVSIDLLQTKNEELNSAIEEHQSVNEELQSTNEELETSKEEMQAVNEELQTVNNELNARNMETVQLNSHLQNFLDNADLAMIFLDRELGIKAFTPSAQEIFHLRDNDFGRPITEIAHRLEDKALPEDVAKVLRSLGVVEREVRVSQSAQTFLMRMRPYRRVDDVIDGVVLTYVDITDRKVLEEERKLRSAIVEASQDAIVGLGPDGRITSWNAAATNVLEAEPAVAVGKPLVWAIPEIENVDVSDMIRSQAASSRLKSVEIRRKSQTGAGDRTLSLSFSPSLHTNDVEWGSSVIVRDITEHVEAIDALKSARQAAEEASLAKTEFVGRMSHELRTPMNGVVGMLEVLLRSHLPEEQSEQAATALKSANDLRHLLDDVIDISRLEAGGVSVELGPLMPARLVQEVVKLFAPRAHEKRLTIETHSDPAVPLWVMMDERRIRQVLINLVGNAVKFTVKGRIDVSTSYEPEQMLLRFEVRDTGVGVAPDIAGNLFNAFVQADTSPTRRHDGAGLGLAICRQLASLMGGSVGFDSEPGQGSRFWFEVRASITVRPDPEMPVPEQHEPLKALRILVVDDHEVSRKIMAALLGQAGHVVAFAEDGEKAVEAAASTSFDLILMDVMMPGMDGLAATRKIRELPSRNQNVPIVALTANALPGDRDRYIAAGMTDYLAKPIDVTALFRVLHAVDQAADAA
jgi:two-component system CheB/CheR fusion protein